MSLFIAVKPETSFAFFWQSSATQVLRSEYGVLNSTGSYLQDAQQIFLKNYDGKLVSKAGVVLVELSETDGDKILQHFPQTNGSRILHVVGDGGRFSLRLNTGYEVLSCHAD